MTDAHSSKVEAKLGELGLRLPSITHPIGAYVPALRMGQLVSTSGQLPMLDGEIRAKGKVGAEISAEEAKDLAQLCCLNALAAIKGVIGDLDRIERVERVVGYVASAPDFIAQPLVVNGASELLGSVFGERGTHVRSAVGVAVLPLGSPVEIELHVRLSPHDEY
ncbi:RidA family protein [Streptomyces sp. 110]|uniref:RidA family protein n=2 Tax=Streptomyces endocoffeicus TaxID=2898945 RepID=A0ABS1Q642_9ACTN|nr:RidA family protein [Streptomyces endocoffeicus]